MTFVDHFLLKVRRAEAQPYRFLKSAAKAILSANIPYPWFLSPIFRFFYGFHYAVCTFFRWLATVFYFSPLFRSKCDSVGKNLRLEQLPHVSGHPRIRIGDDVWISGALDVAVQQGHLEVAKRLLQAQPELVGLVGFKGRSVLHAAAYNGRDAIADFRPTTIAMEKEFRWLSTQRPAPFAWQVQDLHPSGAVGDATAGAAEKGEKLLDHGARAFCELLADVDNFDVNRLAAGPNKSAK